MNSTTRPAPLATSQAAQTAKAALRRLALTHAEPTPENYARAYAEELGIAPRPVLPPRSQALLERIAALLLREEAPRAALLEAFAKGQSAVVEGLLERAVAPAAPAENVRPEALSDLFRGLVRGLERADRSWTLARKKDSLRTLFDQVVDECGGACWS